LSSFKMVNFHSDPQTVGLADTVLRLLSPMNSEAIIATMVPKTMERSAAAYSTALKALQTQTATLGTTLGGLVKENEQQYSRLRESLRAEIEAERAKNEAHHSDLLEAFRKRETEHEERVASFETRESKHVRRSLLEEMKTTLAERKEVSLSDQTVSKRRSVLGGCIVSGVFGLSLVFTGFYFGYMGKGTQYHSLAPISGGSLMVVSALVYYIKWSDQWFRRHADAEFAVLRFENDILRASWLAELLFEWQSEKADSQFPEHLIRQFSAHLFTEDSSVSPSHPSEALVEFVTDAESFKVGKGLLEVVKGKR